LGALSPTNLVSAFDALLAVYLALALVALARLRPATLIVAGNQLAVLRGLSLAAEVGQPRSQSFLPASVFSNANLEIAATLFFLQAVLLACFVLWPERAPATPPPPPPEVPRWLRWALAAYFVVVTLSTRTVLTHSYADPGRNLVGFNLSGAHALLTSLVLYEVARRVKSGLTKPATGLLFILGLFIVTDYLKGSTGFATGYVIIAAILLFREEPRRLRRWLMVCTAMASAVALALAVRGVRATFFEEGTQAVSTFAERLGSQEQRTAQSGEGLELFGNGAQYAAHILECISLYEAGVSREWRSIYLPLEYTFKPSFLVEPLGLSRPKEAAWELSEYYIHGGGIFVLGELYWNGGYFCAVVCLAGLFWFCRRCDLGSRDSALWLLFVCEFAPSLLQGMGYGFAQVSRGALNGLVVLGAVWLLRLLRLGDSASGAHPRKAA
jgi:hypothetical protein